MISESRLEEIFARVAQSKIAVAGDVMLDTYVNARPTGISDEAPVPSVEMQSEMHNLGGAANVAANVAALGAHVTLTGLASHDTPGKELQSLLQAAKISFYPVELDGRPTSHKTRILADGHFFVRLDDEDSSPISAEASAHVLSALRDAAEGCQVLIVSDYNKGWLNALTARGCEEFCASGKAPLVADLKPVNVGMWKTLRVISPNLSEGRDMAHFLRIPRALEMSPEDLAGALQQATGAAVFLTLSQDGMVVAAPAKSEPSRYTALCKQPVSISGAGDSVIAGIAVALAVGASLEEAAQIATLAAAAAVSYPGTRAVTHADVRKWHEAISTQ